LGFRFRFCPVVGQGLFLCFACSEWLVAYCVYGFLFVAPQGGETRCFYLSDQKGVCRWAFFVLIVVCSGVGLLAFPCFVSGLLALPLCGAALTFFAAAKKDKQRKRLTPLILKRVPWLGGGSGASGIRAPAHSAPLTKDSSAPTPHCVRRGRVCQGNQRLRFAQRGPSASPRRDAPALIGQPHFNEMACVAFAVQSRSLPRLRLQQRSNGELGKGANAIAKRHRGSSEATTNQGTGQTGE